MQGSYEFETCPHTADSWLLQRHIHHSPHCSTPVEHELCLFMRHIPLKLKTILSLSPRRGGWHLPLYMESYICCPFGTALLPLCLCTLFTTGCRYSSFLPYCATGSSSSSKGSHYVVHLDSVGHCTTFPFFCLTTYQWLPEQRKRQCASPRLTLRFPLLPRLSVTFCLP